MVDERESPSAGWRTVYREMAADPSAEEATHSCPDCDRACENLLRDVYECEEHGVFRASATDGEKSTVDGPEQTDADESPADETPADETLDETDEVENRAREPAD